MNLTPEQQKQRDELLADMELLRQRISKFIDDGLAVQSPEPKHWPQRHDEYSFIHDDGNTIERTIWTDDHMDNGRLAIGNVYKTDCEATRHVEAMKVQAELRRMPGVCAPPDGWDTRWGIRSVPCNDFLATNDPTLASMALCGVWFCSKDMLLDAVDAITPARLAIFRDDYLQVSINEVQP